MRKRNLILGTCFCMAASSAMAQGFNLQPTPQQYSESKDSVTMTDSFKLFFDNDFDRSPAVKLLYSYIGAEQNDKAMPIYIGVKGDKSIRKYARHIPNHAEGYYLKLEKDRIVVAGADNRGVFYGVQTLLQLMKNDRLPELVVTDFPDVPYRGVVEGFYGTPWSHEARLRQIEFYGKNKMNVYLYGPKDDPYHSTPNWRIPYPEKEAAQLKQLVDKANENEVIFYWAIHPGQDIKWNNEDRDLLIKKLESMYQLGVRAFAVFFDDIWGEGTKAEKQAELLNYIDDNFVKVKGDVAPLVMCPTEYNKSWSNVEGGYLTTLGDKLNKGIEIMWTGNRVIACIDKESMDFINPLLKRKAYIWWNFPVSDYVRDHLLLGPVYGNGTDIKDDLGGFVSNPMERPEASKISLYSVADYAWNLEDFDSEVSWREAIKDLMPNHSEYLLTFASHSSDLGKNGHGFRRDESVDLQPVLKRLQESYIKGDCDISAYNEVMEECERIIIASDMLRTSTENRMLIDEIRPWLIQFKLLGEYGREVLRLIKLDIKDESGYAEFEDVYRHVHALQSLMSEVDATYNQNPYQPGVKVGSKCLVPTFNALFEAAVVKYNRISGAALDSRAEYTPYEVKSNVKQLALLPVRQKGNGGVVSPSNEVILWQADGEFTVIMDYVRTLKSLVLDFGVNDVDSNFIVEVTADGKNWEKVDVISFDKRTSCSAVVDGKKVKSLRIVNCSGKEQKVYFKHFGFSSK